MVEELKTLKDRCVDALQYTTGDLLEISANLTNSAQFALITEARVHRILGSKYTVGKAEQLLRLSMAYQARMREDIVHIGSSFEKPMSLNNPNGEIKWQ